MSDRAPFPLRTAALTALAMSAFAGNSLLCRIALKNSAIDPAGFTSIRLVSGALTLSLLTGLRRRTREGRGNWLSASALFAYAAAFSFAYVSLPAATGALLLFTAVQSTMIGYGVWTGERLSGMQVAGIVVAFGGLVILVLPGLSAPPPAGSALMIAAGIAWGVYSLRGKSAGDPLKVTAGNFQRAALLALALQLLMLREVSMESAGIVYAVLSGALASGFGYALWYSVLPLLKATKAATVQLGAPVLAALGGIVLLGEPLTVRFLIASAGILGGIAMVVLERRLVHETEL
jgi:drug/metabolite transporter (DMT)-like permease